MPEQGIERWTICPKCREVLAPEQACEAEYGDPNCGAHPRIKVVHASILNDCIEELERRADTCSKLYAAAFKDVSGHRCIAHGTGRDVYREAANLLREKAGQ